MKKLLIAGLAICASGVASSAIFADEGVIEQPEAIEPQIVEPQIIEEITEAPAEAVPGPVPQPADPPVCSESCEPCQQQQTVIVTTYHHPVWIEPCFDPFFTAYHPVSYGFTSFGGYSYLPICW